jgi:hypothetical protein
MYAEHKFDEAAWKRIEEIPLMLQFKALDGALRKAAKPIVDRASALAPRSTQADKDKRAKTQRDARADQVPLHKTIGFVIRKTHNGAFAVVGPKWPIGNVAHFNWGIRSFQGGRNMVLWGRKSGQRTGQGKSEHWLKRASDETRAQAEAIIVSEIESFIAGLANG